jgi:hypothetical protein
MNTLGPARSSAPGSRCGKGRGRIRSLEPASRPSGTRGHHCRIGAGIEVMVAPLGAFPAIWLRMMRHASSEPFPEAIWKAGGLLSSSSCANSRPIPQSQAILMGSSQPFTHSAPGLDTNPSADRVNMLRLVILGLCHGFDAIFCSLSSFGTCLRGPDASGKMFKIWPSLRPLSTDAGRRKPQHGRALALEEKVRPHQRAGHAGDLRRPIPPTKPARARSY